MVYPPFLVESFSGYYDLGCYGVREKRNLEMKQRKQQRATLVAECLLSAAQQLSYQASGFEIRISKGILDRADDQR